MLNQNNLHGSFFVSAEEKRLFSHGFYFHLIKWV